jgi:hypothetical protein
MVNVITARIALHRAATAWIDAEAAGTEAEVLSAADQLALAARELTRATDALLPEEQPEGWAVL